jgi:hypothetical protein
MSGTHSILSPSKSAMVLRCLAALAAGKNVPNPPSEYAAEGTAYHEIAARALAAHQAGDADGPGAEAGWECAHYVGQIIEADGFKFTINEEDAAHAQTYVDAIRRLPGQQYYEVRLDTSEVVGVPGQSGTADAVTLDYDHSTIHVDDLKFGRGERVDALDNEQLLVYGAAALLRYGMLHEWKFLKIAIHQPRLGHYDEMVYAADKVEEWAAQSRPRFQQAYALWQDPTKLTLQHFTATEKGCRWCPIRGNCPARTKKVLDMFPVVDMGAGPTPVVATHTNMNDAELAYARDRVDEIEQWCKDIKEEAHKRALGGRTIPGWKLVEGRKGNRKWTDEKAAEAALRAAVGPANTYKPLQIISPADADKAFKKLKADFSSVLSLITQAPPSVSLERESVNKPAVNRAMPEFPIAEPQS